MAHRLTTRADRGRTEPRASRTGDYTGESLATAAALSRSAMGGSTDAPAIPTTWLDRAKLAWTYYIEEPLVKASINTWRAFAIGDEIKLTSDDEAVQAEVQKLHDTLKLSTFVKDMILQLLVKGECVGYKSYTSDGKDIESLICVNPISIDVTYDAVTNTLTKAVQKPEPPDSSSGVASSGTAKEIPLDIAHVVHLKWDAPPFSPRGNSMVLPVFESVQLLREYRKTEKAIAKRWAAPMRLVKVGGAYNGRVIMPEQAMINTTRDTINNMDPKSGLVVPFYVDVETYGAEGEVLKVEEKVKETKEDILTGMGLSRSITSGDGPNFATASVALQKLLIMVREIKLFARMLLDWVLTDWKELSGNPDAVIKHQFSELDATANAVDLKKLYLELYDHGLVSRETIQRLFGLDPAVESGSQETERASLRNGSLVKTLIDAVTAGVLDADEARELLGLPPRAQTPAAAAALALGGVAARSLTTAGMLCDECCYFDGACNRCTVTQDEKAFDSPGCAFGDRKETR